VKASGAAGHSPSPEPHLAAAVATHTLPREPLLGGEPCPPSNDHIVIAPSIRADQHLHDEIRAALARRLPLETVDVTVDKGQVTLMGMVPSYRIRRDAEDIAWWTTGVKGVTNRIEIMY
jgi:hypothetical protein